MALVALALCIIPLPARHADVRATQPVHGAGPLLAGAAQVEIALGPSPVLAGYRGIGRAKRHRTPVYARALVLEEQGARAILATVDTLLIPPGLSLPGCTLLAATHTHTGPGGLWDSVAAGFAGAGRFDRGQREAVQAALEAAVARASSTLQPAQAIFAREEWTHGPARARSEGPIDTGLFVLRLTGPKGPIATLVSYAMHPTSSPHDQLSADWPGAAAALFFEPLFVLPGALGNATFDRALDTTALGARVAVEARRLLLATTPVAGALDCSQRAVELPAPTASRRVPWLLRRAYANLLAIAFAPAAVETRLSLGQVSFVGIPGEPVGELGLSARPSILVSLANGYAGYVETPDHWEAATGEAARTDFGPGLARALGLAP